MVYDKVYELQKAIKESEEYRTYKEVLDQVNTDPKAKQMLNDFRNRQLDLQTRQVQGESVSEEEMEQLNKLYETVNLNDDIRKLLDAERAIAVVIEDINRIITEPLKEAMEGDE